MCRVYLRSESAKGADVLTAVLEAAYIRQAVTERLFQRSTASSSSCAHTEQGCSGTHNGSSRGSDEQAARHGSRLHARSNSSDKIGGDISPSTSKGSNGGSNVAAGGWEGKGGGGEARGTAPVLPLQQQQHQQQLRRQRQRQQKGEAAEAAVVAAQLRRSLPISSKEVEGLCRDAHRRATKDAERFVREVVAAGWKVSAKIWPEGLWPHAVQEWSSVGCSQVVFQGQRRIVKAEAPLFGT